MSRKNYSKAEKRSFFKGMQAQYSKEHPLIRYESVPIYTRYAENGTVSSTFMGKAYGFKTKKAAIASTKKSNDDLILKNSNLRIMKAVKAKKVNTFDSNDCTTEKWITRKVEKPYRK